MITIKPGDIIKEVFSPSGERNRKVRDEPYVSPYTGETRGAEVYLVIGKSSYERFAKTLEERGESGILWEVYMLGPNRKARWTNKIILMPQDILKKYKAQEPWIVEYREFSK